MVGHVVFRAQITEANFQCCVQTSAALAVAAGAELAGGRGGGGAFPPQTTKSRTPLHGLDTGYEHQLRTPPTDKNLPHPNILTCRDVGLWHCDVANLL